MTQRERLVELLLPKLFMFSAIDCAALADYLLDNGVELVVHCCDCEHLGFRGLSEGYCKNTMCCVVSPHDYCSRGKLKEKKQ